MKRKTAADQVLIPLLDGKYLSKTDINKICGDSHGAGQIIDCLRNVLCIDIECIPGDDPADTVWYMTPDAIRSFKENPTAHKTRKRNINNQKRIERDKFNLHKMLKKYGIDFIHDNITEVLE